MLSCRDFYQLLEGKEISFYSGVPDSLLKDFCAYVTDNTVHEKNIITANEGNAIAMAAGYHLATGKIGVVYMQNSGLGNCVNPLTSLTDPEVYSIPLLLLIGWRGEPGTYDEPQHKKMGRIMPNLVKSMEIPYSILPSDLKNAKQCLDEAVEYMKKNNAPYAILIKKDTFDSYKLQKKDAARFPLNREQALKLVVPLLGQKDIVVSTTGKISRELFELRNGSQQGLEKDFLTVGCMGHASSIALGIALQKPARNVYCFDGDGAAIMHMGALSTIGNLKPANLKHVIFNNFAHDSVGGQSTAAETVYFPAMALANGYKATFSAETEEEIKYFMEKIKIFPGLVLLEIRCNRGARENLGRPTTAPIENKKEFMSFAGE